MSATVFKVPLQDFSPDTSIDLWWNAKTRKPSHGPRTHYKKRTPRGLLSDISVAEEDSASEEDEDLDDQLLLDDWDNWMLDK